MDSQPSTPVLMEHDLDDITAKFLTAWEWRDSADGEIGNGLRRTQHRVSSPDTSFDSTCSSPEMPENTGGSQQLTGFYALTGLGLSQHTPQRTIKSKLSTKRRVKASEREKMRMRSLAEALHHLRDYLPPDYTRRGQPLTKIQTLKCTIEYIKELSDILNHS